jgi:putative membrane protein
VNPPESKERQPGTADDRTDLARFRSQLALDRTMLAWVRTALSLISFGFGMVAFFRAVSAAHPGQEYARLHLIAIVFGLALLVLGVVVMLLAGLAHRADLAVLRRGGAPGLRRWPLSLTLTLCMTILGVLGLVALLVV